MQHLSSEPAWPVDTDALPWIATGPGKSFRPLRFGADGWSELMRLEPGSGMPLQFCPGPIIGWPALPATLQPRRLGR